MAAEGLVKATLLVIIFSLRDTLLIVLTVLITSEPWIVARLWPWSCQMLGHNPRLRGEALARTKEPHKSADGGRPSSELTALHMARDLGLQTAVEISSVDSGDIHTTRDPHSGAPARAWSVVPKSSPDDAKEITTSSFEECELPIFKTQRQSLYASIFSLPIELVSDIFLLAADSGPRLLTLEQHLCSMQHVLPQVSRGFRDLALDTPRLWNRITLPLHLECGQEWILRSRTAALDIEALLKDAPESDVNLCMWFLSQTFVRDKCRRLRIHPSRNELPPSLYQSASRLEELEIHYETTGWRLGGSVKPFFESSAPLLRKLNLTGFPFQQSQSLYSNVTVLDLSYPLFTDGPTLSEFQNGLSHARNLRRLIIRHLHFDTARAEVPEPPTISVPTLEFLEFRNAAILVLQQLIPRWEMKRAFELTLLSDYTASYGVLTRSLRLPTSSSFFSNLRRLRVQGSALFTPRETGIDQHSVISIISQTPRLEELHLRYVHLCDDFHRRLDAQPYGQPLAPHLRRYLIRDCPGSSDDAFIAMVCGRIKYRGLTLGMARNCLPASDTWPREAFNLRIEVTHRVSGI